MSATQVDPVTRQPARAPGPHFRNPLGFFLKARRDPFGYPAALVAEFGHVVRIPGPFRGFILSHPDDVKHILQDNNRNYVKGKLVAKAKVLLGEGLFTSEGDFWRRQRRLAQPAFHRERIEGFARTMTDATAQMLDRWQTQLDAPMNLMTAMSDLTLGIVGRTLFSIDLSGESNTVGRAMLEALEHLTYQITHPFAFPLAIPTPRNLRFRRARRELDNVVFDVITHRRRSGEDALDFLSMMMHMTDADTGERMSDRQLRDEVMTFILAGHETTAVTLAWAWHLLMDHPAIEARLRTEVVTALGDRVPTMADLPNLRFARHVIDETLRLFPPVSGIGRQSIKADEVGGYEVPADSIIFLSPYVTHRHADWWDRPDQFDPDRFTPERAANRPRFAYYPFSGGPRLCIGNEFALMEGQLILAMMVQRCRLTRVPGHQPQPELRLTMRPRNGVMATAHRA